MFRWKVNWVVMLRWKVNWVVMFCGKVNWVAGLGSWSQSLSEPDIFGSLEPEPLEKKNRSRSQSRLEKKSGAGAAKKLAGSSALWEDKKHKEIVL